MRKKSNADAIQKSLNLLQKPVFSSQNPQRRTASQSLGRENRSVEIRPFDQKVESESGVSQRGRFCIKSCLFSLWIVVRNTWIKVGFRKQPNKFRLSYAFAFSVKS